MENFSRIIAGLWRLTDWKMSSRELLTFVEQCIDMSVTSFDHADIYGDYECEKLFGDALKLKPKIRKKMQLITKCGIK
ncbi:MAG: aldo/keto reductase, partial [Calditrichia bacterium]|nr:aldo/keto reductase [Calditrichia bacterium]